MNANQTMKVAAILARHSLSGGGGSTLQWFPHPQNCGNLIETEENLDAYPSPTGCWVNSFLRRIRAVPRRAPTTTMNIR